MWDTAGEVGMNSWVTYTCGTLHMDHQKQDDQIEPTYNGYVPIQDVALKTYQKRWTTEKGGRGGSERPLLVAWNVDDDDEDLSTSAYSIFFVFPISARDYWDL